MISLLTLDETAALLRASDRTDHAMLRGRRLPGAAKVSGRRRFDGVARRCWLGAPAQGRATTREHRATWRRATTSMSARTARASRTTSAPGRTCRASPYTRPLPAEANSQNPRQAQAKVLRMFGCDTGTGYKPAEFIAITSLLKRRYTFERKRGVVRQLDLDCAAGKRVAAGGNVHIDATGFQRGIVVPRAVASAVVARRKELS